MAPQAWMASSRKLSARSKRPFFTQALITSLHSSTSTPNGSRHRCSCWRRPENLLETRPNEAFPACRPHLPQQSGRLRGLSQLSGRREARVEADGARRHLAPPHLRQHLLGTFRMAIRKHMGIEILYKWLWRDDLIQILSIVDTDTSPYRTYISCHDFSISYTYGVCQHDSHVILCVVVPPLRSPAAACTAIFALQTTSVSGTPSSSMRPKCLSAFATAPERSQQRRTLEKL